MFSFYKKHNNQLYNKLTELSRNKFFYNDIQLLDNFQTRILLIFFHLSIILKISKKTNFKKKKQDIFDNIFQNIEYQMLHIFSQICECCRLKYLPSGHIHHHHPLVTEL